MTYWFKKSWSRAFNKNKKLYSSGLKQLTHICQSGEKLIPVTQHKLNVG